MVTGYYPADQLQFALHCVAHGLVYAIDYEKKLINWAQPLDAA